MAKVKFSLAAAALASLVLVLNDRKTGREDGDPESLDPGKSVNLETGTELQPVLHLTGKPNPKDHDNEAAVTAQADDKNEKAVVIAVVGPAGKLQDFTLKPGEKRIFSLYEGQRITVDEGDDLT